MDLLTKGNGKYIALPSPFPQENLNLIVKDNVSTKFKDREHTIEEFNNFKNKTDKTIY